MSTNRNTKGQFAHKTAPKKPVKKPTKAQREMERREALLTEYFRSISEQTSAILKQGEKLDQIQRDIEQVRTLAHQTRTNSRANTVILNKTLAGVDLLKSVSSFMQEVEQHKAQPEEPKAEPWAPKSGERVVVLDGRGVKVKYNPGWVSDLTEMIGRIVEVVPSINPRFVRVKETIMDFAVEWLRPATPEEIAEAERQEKLKKLVRGCRVDTPDGEGIYLGFDGSEDEREHIVSLYTDAPQYASFTYSLDQLTPLT